MSLAAGLVLFVLMLLPVVPFEADPVGAHPPEQIWTEVLEWEQTGTTQVWHPPNTQTVPLVPPVPIYETQSVMVSAAWTATIGYQAIYESQSVMVSPAYSEVIGSTPIYESQSVMVSPAYSEVVGSRPIYESQTQCDFDPISGAQFNCRTVQVQVGSEDIVVNHPAVYETRQVQVGSEDIVVHHPAVYETRQVQVGSVPITVNHPAVYENRQVLVGHHTTTTQTIPGYYSTEAVYGWVDNGYWSNGAHDDSAPEHQIDDDPPDQDCTIDPITLLPLCTGETPINDDDEPQNLSELTDDELEELGYKRCEGAELVTTGETCPTTSTDFDGDADDCPEDTTWTDDFGGRCQTETKKLGKNCDENGNNCEDEVEVSTYCPGDSSLDSVGTDFSGGNHYTVCYFTCDDAGTVPGSPYITGEIGTRPDYQCSGSDPTTCANGDPIPAEGCCPDGTPATSSGCGSTQPTCGNGDPMPAEGCCPDGTPATSSGCGSGQTCPNGDPVPSNGGCCPDGTPAPQSGCGGTPPPTCANGDPMPAEGCCPDGTPATSSGCGVGQTCPNGDPVPATGGCCVDGTPAPPGGCPGAPPPPLCPNGDPMPTNGCCVDGTPAPPGGCPTPPPPVMPSVAPDVTLCRGLADELSIVWSWPSGTDTRAVGGFWIDIYGFNAHGQPYDYQGTLSVDATSGLVSDSIGSAVVLSHSQDGGSVEIPSMPVRKLQVQVQPRDTSSSTSGAVLGRADVETTDACSVTTLVCALDAAEAAAALQRIKWVASFSLAPGDIVRDPYVQSGLSRPSRVAMAGQQVKIVTAAGQAADPLRDPEITDEVMADDDTACGNWTLTDAQLRWRRKNADTSVWESWTAWASMLDSWVDVPSAPGDDSGVGAEMEWEMTTSWDSDPHDDDGDPLTADVTVTESVPDSGSGTYFGFRSWSLTGSL